jgi:beta-galactosidase
VLHYYLNFSGKEQTVSYPYDNGTDLLTRNSVSQGNALKLNPWDLAIVEDQ